MRATGCSTLTARDIADVKNMYYDTANRVYQLMEMLDAKMKGNGHETHAPHTTASVSASAKNATHRLVDWVGDKVVDVANFISPGAGKRYENIIHSGEVATDKIADSFIDYGLEEISQLASHHVHVPRKIVNWVGDQAVNVANYYLPRLGDQFSDTIHAGVELADQVVEYAVNAGLDAVSGILSEPHNDGKLVVGRPQQLNQQMKTHSGPFTTRSELSLGHEFNQTNFNNFSRSSSYGNTYGVYDPYSSNIQCETNKFGEIFTYFKYIQEVDALVNVLHKGLSSNRRFCVSS